MSAADEDRPIVLLAFANEWAGEDAAYLRNLAAERKGIRERLERRPWIRVVHESNVTVDDLFSLLDKHNDQITIVHYGGHARGDSILVEDGEGGTRPALAEGLAQRLAMLPALRLVFLNGCSTRAHVDALQAACDVAVIATETAIVDEIARAFAVRVYTALVDGRTIAESFASAEAAMRTTGSADGARRAEATRMLRPGGAAVAEWPWTLHPGPSGSAGTDWRLPDAPPPVDPARRWLWPAVALVAALVLGVAGYTIWGGGMTPEVKAVALADRAKRAIEECRCAKARHSLDALSELDPASAESLVAAYAEACVKGGCDGR